MSITATVTSQPITANVAGDRITATVGSSLVTAVVGGGVGPQGPVGPQGQPGVTAVRLSEMNDVQLSSVVDGDVLRYSSSRWRNFPETSMTLDAGNF